MLKRIGKDKKGFTLAELLIVVAIIGVLVAVSIPIFTSQLRKSRLATNQANARAAKAYAVASYLDDSQAGVSSRTYNYDVRTALGTSSVGSNAVSDLTITGWTASGAFGDDTYDIWSVTLDKDGEIVSNGISYK